VGLTRSEHEVLRLIARGLDNDRRTSPAISSPTVLLSIGYIALFASALGFLFWSYGVSRLGPARAGQYVQLMAVFGTALSFVLLGETFTWAQAAGASLVLTGIMNVEHRANGGGA
jgi:drug/metabolite transporter (DMT)-like permease